MPGFPAAEIVRFVFTLFSPIVGTGPTGLVNVGDIGPRLVSGAVNVGLTRGWGT